MLCTTILQIVSIGTRDNGVAKFERFDGLSETIGFVVVGRLWGTVRQVTKSATACAEFPENQSIRPDWGRRLLGRRWKENTKTERCEWDLQRRQLRKP